MNQTKTFPTTMDLKLECKLQRDAMRWQPISTAPKDNTVIDVWSARWGRCCNYYRNRFSTDKPIYDPRTYGIWDICDATHWQPIPEPPLELT